MDFIGFAAVVMVITLITGSVVALFNVRLPSKVRELRAEVALLDARLRALEETPGTAASGPETTADPIFEAAVEPPIESVLEPTTGGSAVVAPVSAADAGFGSLYGKLEGRFASYWTGILGVLALVVGFSFLAVLTALRLGEFPRFLMLLTISTGFWGASVAVGKKAGGAIFAGWFRSAAGALVLFACVGSATIPWLRWIDSAPQGYALLALGLAVNLYFALSGPYQLLSAFHTVISIAALAVAPAGITVLVAAAVVVGAGLLPGLRRPWPLQLLLAEASFFAFIVVWTLGVPDAGITTDAAALAALVLGLSPVLLGPYLTRIAGAAPTKLSARGAAWIFVAAGTAAFSRSFPAVSIIFVLQALAAYLPGRLSTRVPASVRRMDSIAALTLTVLAAMGLVRLELDLSTAGTVAVLVSLLVATDMRGDRVVSRTATGIAVAVTAAFTAAVFFTAETGPRGPLLHFGSGATLIVLGAVIAIAFLPAAAFLFENDRFRRTLLGVGLHAAMIGVFFAPYSSGLVPLWMAAGGIAALPLGAVVVAVDRFHRRISLATGGTLVMLALVHLASLWSLDATGNLGPAVESARLLLLLAFSLVSALSALRRRTAPGEALPPTAPSVAKSGSFPAVFPGVLLATINAALLVMTITDPLDPWVTGSLWAAVSAALFFLHRRVHSTPVGSGTGDPALRCSLSVAGIGLAIAAGVLAVTPTAGPAGLSEFPALRLLTYLTVAAVLMLWSYRAARGSGAARKIPMIAGIVFILAAAITEGGASNSAVIMIAGAVILLFLGWRGPRFLSGLQVLSVPLFWIGLLALPAGAASASGYRIIVYSAAWWRALASSLAAAGYIVAAYVAGDSWSNPVSEDGNHLGRFRGFVSNNRHRALFLPFFVSIGVFFLVSARGPVLTSLFVIESFAIFALGIVLRERSFRPFSYAILLMSLGRLVLFDMAAADTLERAVVFIIAGAVLLGMNWMYNRFRGR